MRLAAPSRLPGLAKRNLRPRALRFGWRFLHSVPDAARGTLQPGVELQGSIGRLPLGGGTLTEENFVHVHEPSGISVRILMEGSPGAHRRTAREGRKKRPCGRLDVCRSEPRHARRRKASSTEFDQRGAIWCWIDRLLGLGKVATPKHSRTTLSHPPAAPRQPTLANMARAWLLATVLSLAMGYVPPSAPKASSVQLSAYVPSGMSAAAHKIKSRGSSPDLRAVDATPARLHDGRSAQYGALLRLQRIVTLTPSTRRPPASEGTRLTE